MYCPYCDSVFMEQTDIRNELKCSKCGTVITVTPGSGIMLSAVRLAWEGEKIKAIKAVRQYTRFGLKEAKDFIESIMTVMEEFSKELQSDTDKDSLNEDDPETYYVAGRNLGFYGSWAKAIVDGDNDCVMYSTREEALTAVKSSDDDDVECPWIAKIEKV